MAFHRNALQLLDMIDPELLLQGYRLDGFRPIRALSCHWKIFTSHTRCDVFCAEAFLTLQSTRRFPK